MTQKDLVNNEQENQNINTEVEALAMVVGEKTVKFLVVLMIIFFGCFAAYLFMEALFLMVALILGLVSYFR